MPTIIVKTRKELVEALHNRPGPRGFVPTMGALHEGHAALLRQSVRENACTVLSIFVNPSQFGPNEDFSRYPRPFEADVAVAEKAGVQVVFAPSVEDVYPPGFDTHIEPGKVAEPLCGQFRPGHFRGVATVVARLFGLVRPDRAYFGQKDIQQCLVLMQMVKDLALPVEMIIAPTIREADGLAMSSRNRYLSESEREQATMLYRVLHQGQQQRLAKPVAEIVAHGKQQLERAGFKVQYLEVRAYPDLAEVPGHEVCLRPAVYAVAAYLGNTRLIDNVLWSEN